MRSISLNKTFPLVLYSELSLYVSFYVHTYVANFGGTLKKLLEAKCWSSRIIQILVVERKLNGNFFIWFEVENTRDFFTI